ncbi:MAG: fumarate hydratase C-terminal domain-containing protein, partial [Candidatus Jordarchaeales archaeon]
MKTGKEKLGKELRTPLLEEDVRSLKIGDIVFLSGVVITVRDAAHKRMVEYIKAGKPIPVDLRGGVIYHCGPIIKFDEEKMEVVSAGPTTSLRMEEYEPLIISRLGVRMIIGKGGMGSATIDAMKHHGA